MKRTGKSTQAEMLKLAWKHDLTGEWFRSPIALKVPSRKYKLEWFDAVVGGWNVEFKNEEGRKSTMKLSEGIRCSNCPAVVAFDSEGKGVVFLK